MKYYEVLVDLTGKTIGGKDGFTKYDTIKEYFKTLQEAKQYIKNTYGSKRRVKMYIDDKDGKAKHIGYIYTMGINQDISHISNKWYEQHWVSVKEVKKTTIIIK